MSATFLFFQPGRLPLDSADLAADTVIDLFDAADARARLDAILPGIAWSADGRGSIAVEGNWYEWALPQGGVTTLSLRCSLRTDHSALVQSLCDQLGWLAFDGRPMCFQPHRPPMPA
jgi:hypothetical protein